jgi:putative ABC transport system substrate-binding protein
MTTRRQLLIAGALATVGVPEAFAQLRTARVGILHTGFSKESPQIQKEPFERGLRDLGWLLGSHVLIEYRYADGEPSRLPALAEDLVRNRVDVIVARANLAISAARKATSAIPIVMAAYTGDPAADGIVNGLSRPGGNVTGIGTIPSDLDGKRLELLKEGFPSTRRIGVLLNPTLYGIFNLERMNRLHAVARALGVELQAFEIHSAKDIAPAFDAMAKASVDAVLVRGDPQVLDPNRSDIAAHASKLGRPAIYWWPFFVDAGGLVSYGESISGMHYRAASFVSRILKGEKAADLPIEQPTKFELVINLKTARAMKLEMPKSLIFRADRIIQ